jgi:nucleoside-diphosphate-sugar epimerase
MILVTGGTGLVGSHLLFDLTKSNTVVRAIYRDETKLSNVKTIFSYYTDDFEAHFNKIEWVKADLNNIPALIDAFVNVDYVYHCAALISFNTSDFELLKKINIEGTANIVNLCLSEKIKKLCYVSSIAAIGSSTKGNLTEDAEWNPEEDHSVYALTKYGAELEVWRGTQEGLKAVIVNPGVIIGPGFWDSGSGLFFSKVKKGMYFYTTGVTGYIGVKDVVIIMQKLMLSDIKNERYILVAEHLSFNTFLNKIADVLEVKQPKFEAKKGVLIISSWLDRLKALVTRQPRLLNSSIIKSSQSKTLYNTNKFKKELQMDLQNISTVTSNTGKLFRRFTSF